MDNETRIIRTRDIARQLGVSRRTAQRMLEDGRLLKIKLSPRCVGTTLQSIKQFLKQAELRGLEE